MKYGITCWYTPGRMKTAISVEDSLLSEADRAARDMGLSRSRLVSLALEAYLRARRQDAITAQLNAVCAHDDPAGTAVVKRMKSRFRRTIQDRW